MKIDCLKLLNFRNYAQLQINFHPNLNIICGKNGAGKTNLVEAIYVLALTRSFRFIQDKNLILEGNGLCKIEGDIEEKSKTNYRVIISKDGKKVKINNNKVAKLSDYISKITIILFHPDDLKIIKETPSTRRKNLNISISQINLKYLKYLNDYNILLKQRNAYLKQMLINHNESSTYLDILNDKIIQYGLYLYEERKNYIEKINQYVGNLYQQITNLNGFHIIYHSNYENKSREDLKKEYHQLLKKELFLGKTILGIHADDIQFYVDKHDLREYGSEGQQKNAIIAYKLSEIEIFKEKTGFYPILILDDLFSELDKEKIKNILYLLKNEVQIFITTTDLVYEDNKYPYEYKKIWIEEGKIKEEKNYGRRK